MLKLQKKKPDGLKIIVVGCGKVGSTLVEQLSREGHDLTIIDESAAIVENLSTTYDVLGLTGNGASYSLQKEAGVESADLMIAVTGSDELNLLCCTLLMYGLGRIRGKREELEKERELRE